MNLIKEKYKGLLVCLAIAIPAWILGKIFPIIGSAVIAIIAGMVIALFWQPGKTFKPGITFTSKKILQYAVILLGFGLNLNVIFSTGKQSLPIIICTISTSLIIAFALHKAMHIDSNISTLIGVGSSICGGSAIAATAPIIDADDDEVAQAISVIFNVLAALLFPMFGHFLGFDTTSGEAFGIFAGTAVNDTSSVTATASTWDSMWNLGTQTLDKAVTVKLTRTLAIIPITLVLALFRAKQSGSNSNEGGFSFKKAFPMFILWFIVASLITTIAISLGVPSSVFAPLKELSKFFITLAMAAIGLGCNVVKLIKNGGKPILLGGCCWIGITCVSLLLQHVLSIW